MHLSRYARSVTLLCRGDSLGVDVAVPDRGDRGAGERRPAPDLLPSAAAAKGRLEHLTLRGRGGGTETVHADGLFVLIGAEPKTEWLPDEIERDRHGFVVTGRGEHTYQTTMPGVSRSATCAPGRSSGSPPPSARARSSSSRSTGTSRMLARRDPARERPCGRQRVTSSQAAEFSNALSSSSCASRCGSTRASSRALRTSSTGMRRRPVPRQGGP